MSSWSYTLTNKGRQLQAKAQAGTQLVYTKMAVGSGSLSGQSLEAMTALITPVKDLAIERVRRPPGTTRALIGATLRNQGVTTGFYLREVGIFATDPDDGEILYMYANAGTTADYIAPQGDGIIEKALNMNVFVGSAANITANIDESLVYATKQELDEAIAGINIRDASLTEKGVTQLSSATNSSAEDKAATPKAVKTVNEAAMAAQTTANAANLAAGAAQTRADEAFQAGNERKSEVVAALVALGVSASTSDSWDTLISKMSAIIKATGNATAADVLAGKTFSNANGNGLIGTAIGRIITPFIWVGNDGPSYSMPPAGPIEGIPMVESGKTSGSLTKTTSPSVISIFTGSPSFGNSYINCASNIAVDLTFVDYVRIIGKHRRSAGSNDGGSPTNSYFVLGVATTKSARASAFTSKETIYSTNTDFLPFERVIDVRSLNGQYYVKIELLVGNWVDLYEYVNLDEIALIRSKNN